MFDAALWEQLAPHRRRALFLDSNLLLLLVAGRMGPAVFGHFKRVGFSFEDAVFLNVVAARFHSLLTTPAVLAETSNLGGYAPLPTAATFRQVLASWIAAANESFRPALTVTARATYAAHGFTDATISVIADAENAVVLTADLLLLLELESHGVACLNFKHLRLMRLLG